MLTPVEEIVANHPNNRRAAHAPEFVAGAGHLDGRVVPLAQTRVPVTDLGFMRADAVYDVVTVSRGQFFALAAHQERFARSCARMQLTNPLGSRDADTQALTDMVRATGLKDAYVWWCVTRGPNPALASDRLYPDSFENRFYGFVIPYVFIKGAADREAGINLWVSRDHIRIPPDAVDPRAKNFCSLDLAMSLFEAGENGANWSVLTDGHDALTESPGSNVFIVKDGRVLTPDLGCLEGITRKTALTLCAGLGLKVESTQVTVDMLKQADEAFLTSSAGGILPVAAVDGQRLAGGVGPVTTALHNLYWQRRWEGWQATPLDYREPDQA